MKSFCAFSLLLAIPAFAAAQTAEPAPSANPVSDALRFGLTRSAKNMTAAVTAMPADKFPFKPTPDQMSFAHLAIHIAESNNLFCSKISGVAAPEGAKLAETDAKEKLVACFERARIMTALEKHQGNVSAAARDLGIHRQSLQQKMTQLGIKRE